MARKNAYRLSKMPWEFISSTLYARPEQILSSLGGRIGTLVDTAEGRREAMTDLATHRDDLLAIFDKSHFRPPERRWTLKSTLHRDRETGNLSGCWKCFEGVDHDTHEAQGISDDPNWRWFYLMLVAPEILWED